jgi:aspartate/methionine/tyrosine aminotransferase
VYARRSERFVSDQPRSLAGAAVFANTDYVGWYRDLFELMRSGERATLLFDSTITEPTTLIREHAKRAFAEEYTQRFPSTFGWGSPLLIDSIARRYRLAESSILTTAGCTSALSHVYSTFLGPGAHVIIETPHFELLPRLAAHRSARISFLKREPGTYAIDPDRLAQLITTQTRLIVLTNAHNPSGTYLDDDALKAIAGIANRFDVPVLVDEVYGDFVPAPRRSGPAALLDPCFISISSLTKVYGLQALRCGWIVAAEHWLRRIRPVYSQLESSSSKLTHGIASLVLDELDAYEAHWRAVLERTLPIVRDACAPLIAERLMTGAVPDFGCMYFPRLTRVRDTRRLASWMWDQAQIGIAPGEFFGASGHIRIGYGRDGDDLASGLERFARGLRSYSEEYS